MSGISEANKQNTSDICMPFACWGGKHTCTELKEPLTWEAKRLQDHNNKSSCPDSTFLPQDDLDDWEPSQTPTNTVTCYLQVEDTITWLVQVLQADQTHNVSLSCSHSQNALDNLPICEPENKNEGFDSLCHFSKVDIFQIFKGRKPFWEI